MHPHFPFEDNYPEYVQETFGFRYDLDHLGAHKRARLWALGRGLVPAGEHEHDQEVVAQDELDTVAMAHALLRQGAPERAAESLMPLLHEETFHPDVAWDEVAEFVVTTLAAFGREPEATALCQLASSKLDMPWSREPLIRGTIALCDGHGESARTWFDRYIEGDELDALERRYEVALKWEEAGEQAEAVAQMRLLERLASAQRNFGVLVDAQMWLGQQVFDAQSE